MPDRDKNTNTPRPKGRPESGPHPQRTASHWLKEVGLWGALLMPLALFGHTLLKRPALTDLAPQPLFQGITYQRQVLREPRPLVVHLVEIELTEPGVMPFVTPGFPGAEPNAGGGPTKETLAAYASEFLETHQLQLATNANFFFPFWERVLWDSGPKSGGETNVIGTAISAGQPVSLAEADWPALCFLTGRAVISPTGACPENTQQAVAGIAVILEKGDLTAASLPDENSDRASKPYAVNIAALDSTGQRLWLLIGDGKQPLYSEGMRLSEAAEFLQTVGADIAVQLDGGGSTTLAIEDVQAPGSAKLLNSVVHGKVPGWERPVANHLGFFARPLAGE